MSVRLFADDVSGLVAFLREVFGAQGAARDGGPVELRIGGSVVLVSSTEQRAAQTATIYVYVDDPDACWSRAVAAGAESVESPIETPYGDRRATVRDRFGNTYQVARSSHPSGVDVVRSRLLLAYEQIRRCDLEALMEMFAPDVEIRSSGAPVVVGRAAVREMWAGTFRDMCPALHVSIDDAVDLGDTVALTGSVTGELVPRDGSAPVVVHSWFQQLYRRDVAGTPRFWRGANGSRPPAPT